MQIELRPKLSFDVYAHGQLLGNFVRVSEWEGFTLLKKGRETLVVQRDHPLSRFVGDLAGNESEIATVTRATAATLADITTAIADAPAPKTP